ncbi:MAG: CDP-alcohol phosphatidyltransferase family protein [Pseudomonadota bacterium]|nr:CDP-alcohol phosphatidyltransferase family protein [Pseudomonadota bacterium]
MSADTFQAAHTSRFESWLLERVCKPALARIPTSVHPNSLSLANHLLCWAVFYLAMVSASLDPVSRAVALALTGVGMFGTMVLDCLDGMQARRTQRCSKLGELMDHGLDAVHIPLITAGLSLALQLDPWAVIGIHAINAMIYNAQLVLYHRTGKFELPSIVSGADMQMVSSLLFAVVGIFFYFYPRETPWVGHVVAVACIMALYTGLKSLAFYYGRLEWRLGGHLPFMALVAACSALYWVGALDTLAFTLLVAFLSFRMTGSFVLHSILGRPYSGLDAGAIVWVAAIAASHVSPPMSLGPTTLRAVLPYLACAYLAVRNLSDVARHFDALRPRAQNGASM